MTTKFTHKAISEDFVEAETAFRDLLLSESGTLSHWAAWNGNRYWLSPDGKTALAYRLVGKVALIVTEPLSAKGASDEWLSAFVDFCEGKNWVPVFYCVKNSNFLSANDANWRKIEIGTEAVVPLDKAFAGSKAARIARHSRNKAARHQTSARWCHWADLSQREQNEIREILSSSIERRKISALGFTLGSVAELEDKDVWLLLAIAADESIVGVSSWLPIYRDGFIVGRTLDVMSRRNNSFNGVLEFLVAFAITKFQSDGLEVVSLSGIPLGRGKLDQSVSPETENRLFPQLLSKAVGPVYNIDGLLKFKSKFQPEFNPLFLVFQKRRHIPKILQAIARAYFSGSKTFG